MSIRIFRQRKEIEEMERKDATFEAWLAQRGTGFLPTDTTGWPVAQISPSLTAILGAGSGSLSYGAAYRAIPAVYTVVEFLAWQISQIGIKVYQRVSDTEREHLQDSPITTMLDYPAPGLTYSQFMHRTVADICIYGNCYWAKLEAPTRGGRSRVLTPLPAAFVTPRGGTLIKADTYDVALGATNTTLKAEDVVHFRRYNPDDMRIGVSPLEPLRGLIREEAAATAYREVFWRKSARMEGIITRPADAPMFTDDARTNLRESWRRFSRGGDKEGETAVLEEGMAFQALSFSPKDAEFLEGRKSVLEAVARAYGVPVSVLGLSETATYASQREFHKALYQDTLAPWTRMIEDQIDAELIPWFTSDDSIYVEFSIEEKLRGSLEEQAETIYRSVGGPWLTRNEARAFLNLPQMDGAADDLLLPAGVLPENAPPPPPAETGATPTPLEAAAVLHLAEKADDG